MTLLREKPFPASDPLSLIRLHSLMQVSEGHPNVPIGLIDGPVNLQHPAFQPTPITTTPSASSGSCRILNSQACFHGTFVAGMLSARRDTSAPGICPACPLLIRPVFSEAPSGKGGPPSTTETELVNALIGHRNPRLVVVPVSARAAPSDLLRAVAHASVSGRRSLIPPLLNAEAAWKSLQTF